MPAEGPAAVTASTVLLAVLQLRGAGRLRCSEKTQRPAAATVAAVAEVLAGGDFYAAEPIVAFAWPLVVQAGGLAELAGGVDGEGSRRVGPAASGDGPRRYMVAALARCVQAIEAETSVV